MDVLTRGDTASVAVIHTAWQRIKLGQELLSAALARITHEDVSECVGYLEGSQSPQELFDALGLETPDLFRADLAGMKLTITPSDIEVSV